MPKYGVTISRWVEMSGYVEVEAESVDGAIDAARLAQSETDNDIQWEEVGDKKSEYDVRLITED